MQMVNEVTFLRYRKCLDRMEFYLNKDHIHLRSLIRVFFGEEKTENFDPNTKVELDLFDKGLNQYQRHAVRMGLTCKHFGLIHGPPGTGKTKTVCELVQQLVRKEKKLLVTAASNVAVDNILDRLIDTGINIVRVGNVSRVLETSKKYTIGYIVGKEVKNSADFKSVKKEITKLN